MKIRFTKMEGLGNDYVYLDCTKSVELNNIASLARFVSNRHFGVGADGLILICKSQIADFKMRMFNSDGSEAQMCGNGIRCVGKFVYDKRLTQKTDITIETLAGIKTLKLHLRNEKVDTVTVEMGKPILIPSLIPVIANKTPVTDLTLKVDKEELIFTCVSMGNPHAITVVERVADFPVVTYGNALEVDSHFPEKANIEFIEIEDKNHIKMRVWERGSGETLACGTGACAAVVACILNQLTHTTVTVELLGGNLEIEWKNQNQPVYMTGPARTIFEGEIEWEEKIKC